MFVLCVVTSMVTDCAQVYVSVTGGAHSPLLLRDLLVTRELEQVLGPTAVRNLNYQSLQIHFTLTPPPPGIHTVLYDWPPCWAQPEEHCLARLFLSL